MIDRLIVEIAQSRAGFECSAGDCGALDCCRCHPEIEKIVVEPPPAPTVEEQ